MGRIAAAMGTPYMPHQQLIADVGTEVDNDTGQFAYREIVISLMRQQGKTTMLLPKIIHVSLGMGPRQQCVYTAQTGTEAAAKWRTDQVVPLRASPLGDLFNVRERKGHEQMEWINGSLYTIRPPTEKAGHGIAGLDLGIQDEAWSAIDARVERSLRPAMVTRPFGQFWVLSAAGTAESRYWNNKMDAGRLRVAAGVTKGTAYFEWSADEDADPYDPATWWSCMPALGRTITETTIEAELDSADDIDDFKRNYLNIRRTTRQAEWIIPRDDWDGCLDAGSGITETSPTMWSVEMSDNRDQAAIGAAGLNDRGAIHLEIVEYRDGPPDWVVDELAAKAKKWDAWDVAVDGAGPAAALIPALEKKKLKVHVLGTRQCAAAFGSLQDAVKSRTVARLDQIELDVALSGAAKRRIGNAWLIDNVKSLTDVSPLVTVMLARWLVLTAEQQEEASATY